MKRQKIGNQKELDKRFDIQENRVVKKNLQKAMKDIELQGGQMKTGKPRSQNKSVYDLPLFKDQKQTNLF